jgi:hypothetical protein
VPPSRGASQPLSLSVALLEGSETLEVVGESHHQDALWRIVGAHVDARVRKDIVAVLTPDPSNPYDRYAVGVWIGGLLVGQLPKQIAAVYQPAILRHQTRYGLPVALRGVIVGGGHREDGSEGLLGVFLNHDPTDFGVTPPLSHESRTRTGASELAPMGYLRWYGELPDGSDRAIPFLRRRLAAESNPIERHFMFTELERRLYHARDAYASALEDYDATCAAHDAEMDVIAPLLLQLLGGVPLLDTYRQACIRQAQLKNWEAALRWAERGLDLYGDRALRAEWTEDLAHRAGRCRRTAVRRQNPMAPGEAERSG